MIDRSEQIVEDIKWTMFGMEENYVLPVQTLSDPEELIRAYDWMMEREAQIRGRLETIMPDYCNKAKEAGEELRRLWQELHRA